MTISASYLHAFLVMTSFSNKQYSKNRWNDFINVNYATSCEDLTLFMNYFISHDIFESHS